MLLSPAGGASSSSNPSAPSTIRTVAPFSEGGGSHLTQGGTPEVPQKAASCGTVTLVGLRWHVGQDGALASSISCHETL